MTALDAEQRSHIVTIEDERYVYALTTGDYLRGFAGAADTIAKGVGAASTSTAAVAEKIAPAAIDESQTMWGLQLTGVVSCSYTGKGVKIAILDTGFDKSQPDFGSRVAGMNFISEIANQSNSTDDVVGHGTHVTGTAAGSTQPAPGGPRYGIPSDALIYIVKMLDDSGRGADGSILAGIDWAISQGCAIVSMSLGGPSAPGGAFSQVYETVAQRALAQGTLIIAAAGNESSRSMGYIAPVSHPANCPSILAVAAVDKWLQVADFSSAGPEVNIAGPGVDVFSSWPTPRDHRVISGTSMATPHVAGIAALYVEAQAVTGNLLRKALTAQSPPAPRIGTRQQIRLSSKVGDPFTAAAARERGDTD